MFIVCTLISYYVLSIGVTFYNKFMLDASLLNFPYPLLSIAAQTGLHSLMSGCILWILRQGSGEKVYLDRLAESTRDSWRFYLSNTVPCGLVAGLEIGLGSVGFRYVDLSLAVVIKSSTPIFSVLASFLFGLEKPRATLMLILLTIGVGVVMTACPSGPILPGSKDPSWGNFEGSVFVLASSMLSGLRWVLAQWLISNHGALKSNGTRESTLRDQFLGSLLTIFQISPVISISCALLSFGFEDWKHISSSPFFASHSSVLFTLLLVGFGGWLSFFLVLSEFLFVAITSVVTLSIVGMLKEVVIIVLSVLVFGDVLVWYNHLGLGISIAGILWYNYYRHITHRNQEFDTFPRMMEVHLISYRASQVFLCPQKYHRLFFSQDNLASISKRDGFVDLPPQSLSTQGLSKAL